MSIWITSRLKHLFQRPETLNPKPYKQLSVNNKKAEVPLLRAWDLLIQPASRIGSGFRVQGFGFRV